MKNKKIKNSKNFYFEFYKDIKATWRKYMFISKINQFTTFKSNYKNTFRDNELFDDEKDIVTNKYRQYGIDDIPSESYSKSPLDYDYTLEYQIKIINPPNLYSKTRPSKISLSEDLQTSNIEDLDEIIDACMLLDSNNQKRFSGNLYNHIKTLSSNPNYTPDIIFDICDAAKLHKANGRQYIDYDLLNAGFFCYEKITNQDIEDTKKLINALKVTDRKGNQIFNQSAFDMIKTISKPLRKTQFSIDDKVKLIKAGIVYDDNNRFIRFSELKAFQDFKR